MRVVSLLFHDVYVASPRESGFASAAADAYKLAVGELDAQLAGLDAVAVYPPLTASDLLAGGLGEPGRCSLPTALPFLVTADDGGLSYSTLLADRLESRGWRGHCFVSTDLIGRPGFLDARQIRELDARGHVIGSHSASHPRRFSACTREQMLREWSRSRQVLEDLLGHEVRVASLPGGYYSPEVAGTACEAGLTLLFTSEPRTAPRVERGCLVVGRFAIRSGDRPGRAGRLIAASRRTRCAAWVSWNAKGLIKPLLGPWYIRAGDRLRERSAPRRRHA